MQEKMLPVVAANKLHRDEKTLKMWKQYTL